MSNVNFQKVALSNSGVRVHLISEFHIPASETRHNTSKDLSSINMSNDNQALMTLAQTMAQTATTPPLEDKDTTGAGDR